MSYYNTMSSYYDTVMNAAKKDFEHHMATFEKLNEEISVLNWEAPNTTLYSVRYVMDRNQLYISGDLGSATFNLTWNATPESFANIGIHYFTEKLSSFSRDNKIIDKALLKAELKERFEELTEQENLPDNWLYIEISEDGEVDPHEDLKEVFLTLVGMDDLTELAIYLRLSDTADILEEYDPDYWEWAYSMGSVINTNIVYYLVGLQMAAEQLSRQN